LGDIIVRTKKPHPFVSKLTTHNPIDLADRRGEKEERRKKNEERMKEGIDKLPIAC
jgi:hypothetical protein